MARIFIFPDNISSGDGNGPGCGGCLGMIFLACAIGAGVSAIAKCSSNKSSTATPPQPQKQSIPAEGKSPPKPQNPSYPYGEHPPNGLAIYQLEGKFGTSQRDDGHKIEGRTYKGLNGKTYISHGYSKITWPDNSFYIGKVHAGKPDGVGFLKRADGYSYFGEFEKNGLIDGAAIWWEPDGTCYHGEYEDGQLIKNYGALNLVQNQAPILPANLEASYNLQLIFTKGEAKDIKYENGNAWKGDTHFTFENPHIQGGYGVYTLADGTEFWGKWSARGFDGPCYIEYTNGSFYYGDVKDWQPNGYGVMWNPNTGYHKEGRFIPETPAPQRSPG